MIALGVNIDHVATVRQTRRTYEPDPLWAAVEAHLGGADGRTLYCLIYDGNLDDIPKGARNAIIETAQVEVSGAGSP